MKADPTTNIPGYNAKSDAWIQWHKELKSNFGKKVANSLFLKAWGIRGNSSANTNELREYLKKQGITLSGSAWDSIVDAGADIGDFFGDFLSISKYAGIALGVIVIGGIGMIVFNIAKDPVKAIGTAASLRTGGLKK